MHEGMDPFDIFEPFHHLRRFGDIMHDDGIASFHDPSDRTFAWLKVSLVQGFGIEPYGGPHHQCVRLIIPIQQCAFIRVEDPDRDVEQRLKDPIDVHMLH